MVKKKKRSCKHKKGKSLELGSLWFMVTILISIDDHSPLWIYNGCSKTWECSMNRAPRKLIVFIGASQSTKGGFTMLHTLLYIDAHCRFFWDSPSSISTHRLKQFYLSMWFPLNGRLSKYWISITSWLPQIYPEPINKYIYIYVYVLYHSTFSVLYPMRYRYIHIYINIHIRYPISSTIPVASPKRQPHGLMASPNEIS